MARFTYGTAQERLVRQKIQIPPFLLGEHAAAGGLRAESRIKTFRLAQRDEMIK